MGSCDFGRLGCFAECVDGKVFGEVCHVFSAFLNVCGDWLKSGCL